MLEDFDAMPTVPGPDGTLYDLSDPEVLQTVKKGWLRDGWKGQGLWPDEADPAQYMRRTLGEFFAQRYRALLSLSEGQR